MTTENGYEESTDTTALQDEVNNASGNSLTSTETKKEISGVEIDLEKEDETMIDICDRAGATDEWAIRSLFVLANGAEKAISTGKGEYENVPDNATRLESIKTLLKLKGRFDQAKKAKKKTGFKYILID